MALDVSHKIQHSLSTREEFSTIPILSWKYMNVDADSDLVKISAICWFVRMYCNFRAPLCTRSLVKWYLIQCVSICHETLGSLKALCNSNYRNGWSLSQAFPRTDQITTFWAKLLPCRHRLQQYTLPQLYYELWNLASYWTKRSLLIPYWSNNQRYFFRSTALPAQSESVYPYNITSLLEVTLNP